MGLDSGGSCGGYFRVPTIRELIGLINTTALQTAYIIVEHGGELEHEPGARPDERRLHPGGTKHSILRPGWVR
jgi:hypothetical protein